MRNLSRRTLPVVLSCALSLLSAASPAAARDAADPEKIEKAAKAALSKLDAQLPLTAGDHAALKKAATLRKVDELRVCGDPGNMPLSNVKGEGYQNKMIELVAEAMGTHVSYFWRPYLERGLTRQTFDTNDCDVLLDMPVGYERMLTTEPIYRTTYVLAWRTDSGLDIKSLDDPRLKELRLGVFQTSGLRMALNQRGIISNVRLHVLSHSGDLTPEQQPWRQVQQVVDGELDVAGVWGPFAGWLKAKGAPITVVPVNLMDDDVPLEFDLALGLRKRDVILKYKIELALEEKKAEIEKILRDFGVPLVQCSRCVVAGDLPAHGIYTKLVEAKPSGSAKTVSRDQLETWLAEGADLDQELANAVLGGDLDRVRLLVEKGADVNKRDRQGYAPLAIAARNRQPALIELLLDLGADIDAADSSGYTPLLHAVMRDHKPSIELLAKRGADLEKRAADGSTPLAAAIVESKLAAAMALITAGAPVSTPSGEAGLTPLMLAAGREPVELSLGAGRQLIEKPDPHYPGTLEVARALIDRGADVNAVSRSGVTALMLAAAHNIPPMVGLLVQSGADPALKSAGGKTALEIAQDNGNASVVSVLRLLEQAGSN